MPMKIPRARRTKVPTPTTSAPSHPRPPKSRAAIGCSDEDEHNCGDHEPHHRNQAHHSKAAQRASCRADQDKPVNFGAHKMRHVRLQFTDLLLEAAERWLGMAPARRASHTPVLRCVHSAHSPVQGDRSYCTCVMPRP